MLFTMFLLDLCTWCSWRAVRRRRQRCADRDRGGGAAAGAAVRFGQIAMATLGVKEVTPAQEPELHGIVERLCVQADLPKPRVCVMESSMPNAFAMGRSKKSTTVCATRGILQLLSPAELEGVMAHELTHVVNRDVMVMTLASFFATLASMIIQFSFFFGGGFGGGYGRDRDEEEAMLRSSWSPRSFTRSRSCCCARCLATASSLPTAAARTDGPPSALASALLKISGTMERVPSQDLRARKA